jgi:protein SCO1/2
MTRTPTVAAALAAIVSLAVAAAYTQGDDGRAEVRSIITALRACDGATDGRVVAGHLERLAGLPSAGSEEVAFLVRLVDDRSALFRNRDPHDVIRLRSLALAAIARIGPTAYSAAFIAQQLDESVDPRAVAAAARAFARLPGEKRWGLRPLRRALLTEMADEPLCLDRYGAHDATSAQLTTMRLEVVRALASLGSEAREVVPLLESAGRSRGQPGSFQERLAGEIDQALAQIRSSVTSDSRSAAAMEECPECSQQLTGRLVSRWLQPGLRAPVSTGGLRLTDHDGDAWRWSELTGRPAAVTFFYTRCQNPNRCERTMSRITELRAALEKEGLLSSVRLLCVTMEPAWDTPAVLREYATSHGLAGDRNVRFLRPDPTAPRALSDALDAPINQVGTQVNTHGTALYLLDRRGQVARTYRSLLWNTADVAADLRRLVEEPLVNR